MNRSSDERRGVLFLCVANSARSQLAEGWGRRLAPEGVVVHSAGSHPSRVNPFAVRVMREVGIDLDTHRSKAVDDVPLDEIETVVTLCAEEVCPALPPGCRHLHWPFPDPAATEGGEELLLEAFRTARDGIEAKVRGLFADGGRRAS